MTSDAVDPSHIHAVSRAESIAQSYVAEGGEIADLFTTFALFVAQEDGAVGLHCLDALEHWFFGPRTRH
jgi:hypothetical protein